MRASRFSLFGRTTRPVGDGLSFMRGKQQGWHEAEKAIRRTYPRAAAAIRARFLLEKDGSIKF